MLETISDIFYVASFILLAVSLVMLICGFMPTYLIVGVSGITAGLITGIIDLITER